MKKVLFIYGLVFMTIIFSACQEKKMNMTAMFEGNDLMQNAQIVRDKNTKLATIKININGSWKLFAGPTVDSINFDNPLLIGEGSGTYALNVPDSIRSYFQLITEDGKAILAENHLPMNGGYNFRDLGGIRTVEGKYIKWGKLFRADDLLNLDDADLHYLSSIPIHSVVDFRSGEEIKEAPDKMPGSVYNDYHLILNPGNISMEHIKANLNNIDFSHYMEDINIQLVSDSNCISRYREFFKILQDEDNAPILYHCSAGKDRTGLATALILYSLGVDDKTIMEDYLLSGTYLQDKYNPMKERFPQLAPLLTVKSEYLQAALDKIKEDYGTIDNYLVTILDVDINKMKEIYLY